MTERPSVRELSDDQLEQQGTYAHATRNWVFLHGTAEQFATHTERMLALEQEYLRRYPKRTWQGTSDQPAAVDEATRLRVALRGLAAQIAVLLGEEGSEHDDPTGPAGDTTRLLRRVAAAGGRLHKLELHQLAREVGVDPAQLASLYRGSAPLLRTERDDRVLTEAGHAAAG